MREHFFTTYVRTKMVFQHRLKDLKTYDSVKIYMYELKKLGVSPSVLFRLKSEGQIWYDTNGDFKVIDSDGPIKPEMLELTRKHKKICSPLSNLHLQMRSILMDVSVKDGTLDDPEFPVYFKAFLEHRKKALYMFFTVDGFSGRVHTPIVSLKKHFRGRILLQGFEVASLDVKQMQPTILGKILKDSIGDNPFSKSIEEGKDVYQLLLDNNAELNNRDDAKKFLYQLIFGKPMEDLRFIFKGNSGWINWINNYKSRKEERNPHHYERHTNLAWLLQYSEVKVMSEIWEILLKQKIPFLTIHDDVLVKRSDIDRTRSIMETVLTKHFTSFKVVLTQY